MRRDFSLDLRNKLKSICLKKQSKPTKNIKMSSDSVSKSKKEQQSLPKGNSNRGNKRRRRNGAGMLSGLVRNGIREKLMLRDGKMEEELLSVR